MNSTLKVFWLIIPIILVSLLIGCCPSYQVGTKTVVRDSTITTAAIVIHDTVRVDRYVPSDVFNPGCDTFAILQQYGILDKVGIDKKSGCSYKIFFNPAMQYFIIDITVPQRSIQVPTEYNTATSITPISWWARIKEFCVDFFITIGILIIAYAALKIGQGAVKIPVV
jgi:hypothetical protein